MNSKSEHTAARPSWWRICYRHPLLLKIVVWLGSLSFIGSAGIAGANLMPVSATTAGSPSIDLVNSVTPPTTTSIDLRSIDWQWESTTANYFRSQIDRQQRQLSPPVTPKLLPQRKFIRPQHADLLTADNYLVGISATDDRPKAATGAIEIPVPPPRQTAIPSHARNIVKPIASQVIPSHASTAAPESAQSQPEIVDPKSSNDRPTGTTGTSSLKRGSHRNSIPPNHKSAAGLKSNLVMPMKPRLSFSQPRPIATATTSTIERLPATTTPTPPWVAERLATISTLQITDPSFQTPISPDAELPKQKIALAPNTQLTVGVRVLEANDLTDTIDPLFDRNSKDDESLISRFGTRAGIYYLVAGSGVGIRHRFNPTLEGSVGVLVRSNDDNTQQNNKAVQNGGLGSSKNSSRKIDGQENGLGGSSLSNSYGTIAQLTYTPSPNTKIGLTYAYGYDVYPEIGSASANQTNGGTSALGLQSFVQLQPNLAVGGRIGFHQNTNVEFNKNIFTWALTGAIPDLGGKGNLAGLIIGQEPRVIAASNLDVQDTGSALHLEGFYVIKINNDLSITPAIVYLAGPNIENNSADSDSIIGAIGITYKF